MANYRPNYPFCVPLFLYVPSVTVAKGVAKKQYPEQGILFYCSFRTFGGTEKQKNDVIAIEDTATIETWYRPEFAADCIVKNVDGKSYEILGTPENINMRNQIVRFKIRAIDGGA
jgi:hypothetical protein